MPNPVFELIRAARGSLVRSLAIGLLLPLGACASFEAHPRPVLNVDAVVQSANAEPVSTAIHNFYSPRSADRKFLSPIGYRNKIVGTYVAAADLRFNEFRRSLSRESRGSSFALDLGILGTAGGASIAGKTTANALSAIASGLTGTRAALNRDVFFDRTLPALFAAMDASRTEIRTAIMLGMRRSATEYPLPVALADVAAYENAGSLDAAIERITAEAADAADQAQENYAADVQSYVGPPEAGVPDVKRRVRAHLLDLQKADNRQALLDALTAVGGVPADGVATLTSQQLRFLIEDKMAEARTVEAANEFAAKVGLPEGDDQ